MKKLLFNPGPVSVPESIRKALLGEDIVHRGKEFEQLYREISELIIKLLKGDSNYVSLLITGSGTAANEAMVSSFLLDRKALVICTDEFGNRLRKMCDTYKIKNLPLEFSKIVDLTVIERALRSNREIDSVLVPYVETAVGIQHPIREIGNLLKSFYPRKIDLYVDGVSAFAATKIDVINENITAITSSACKGIMAFPGLSFICCRKELFDRRRARPRNVYLDLFKAYHFYTNSHQTPNTPAIQLIGALKKALEIFAEGEDKFIGNYVGNFNFLYKEIKKIGYRPFFDDRQELCNTTMVFYLPKNMEFDDFDRFLRDEGFIIYGCKGELKRKAFIVSVMGSRKRKECHRLIDVLKKVWGKTK